MQFLVPRQRRGFRMRTPEESTPTPAVHRARSVSPTKVAFPMHIGPSSPETPRPSSSASGGNRVRPSIGAVVTSLPEPPTTAQVELPNRAMSICVPSNVENQLARKKSGEPLKSSLKSRRTVVRGDLSVVTGEAMSLASSMSEPTTPIHSSKSVHFDSQLEHVKLFLAEQKPLAVSRDGSPTTDTSGTDSDFPAFIFGEDEKPDKKGKLVMEVTNMPGKDEPTRIEADCALEELTLGPDGATIQGRVRVKNIAFEKWVAVRFTFDWWQTTSEVTARYARTLESGVYDIFTFTIRLNDMLARIEEKTLFMAVRYTVAGLEIWDNNDSRNFQVEFSRQLDAPKPAAKPATPSQSGSETEKEQTQRKHLSTLHLKLEKVASDQSPPAQVALSSRGRFQPPFVDPAFRALRLLRVAPAAVEVALADVPQPHCHVSLRDVARHVPLALVHREPAVHTAPVGAHARWRGVHSPHTWLAADIRRHDARCAGPEIHTAVRQRRGGRYAGAVLARARASSARVLRLGAGNAGPRAQGAARGVPSGCSATSQSSGRVADASVAWAAGPVAAGEGWKRGVDTVGDEPGVECELDAVRVPDGGEYVWALGEFGRAVQPGERPQLQCFPKQVSVFVGGIVGSCG